MNFIIKDMSCSHCKAALEKALLSIGAADFEVDLRMKTIRIKDELPLETVEKAIRDAGYTPQLLDR